MIFPRLYFLIFSFILFLLCFFSSPLFFFFFLRIRPPPRSPLFPYTTLFRSSPGGTAPRRGRAHRRGLGFQGRCLPAGRARPRGARRPKEDAREPAHVPRRQAGDERATAGAEIGRAHV